MPNPSWEDRYESGDLPWDTGRPDPHLVELVRSGTLRPGRLLEVGCGTGTNAWWLAAQGFEVLGVDLSPTAIAKARAKQPPDDRACRFAVHDFVRHELLDGPFDAVFDRGCFHVFDEADERALFAQRVVQVLAQDGVWASLAGSTEGPERDHGPPRRSARDLVIAIEPALELLDLRAVPFYADIPTPARGWLCIARRRRLPAQPSTRRPDVTTPR